MTTTIRTKTMLERKNKTITSVFKFGLNSSFGVFSRKPDAEQTKTCTTMEEFLDILGCYDVTDIQEIDENHIDVTYDCQQKDYPNTYYNLPIGAQIVNSAKQYVDKMINNIMNTFNSAKLYMVNADCVAFSMSETEDVTKLNISKDLGALKHQYEGEINAFYALNVNVSSLYLMILCFHFTCEIAKNS